MNEPEAPLWYKTIMMLVSIIVLFLCWRFLGAMFSDWYTSDRSANPDVGAILLGVLAMVVMSWVATWRVFCQGNVRRLVWALPIFNVLPSAAGFVTGWFVH